VRRALRFLVFERKRGARPSPHLPALTSAEPRIQSWFTDNSGQYARLYQTSAEEATGPAVTTWNRGQGLQAQPTYAGVHEVSSDATDVYIRSTGLASYIMGPWHLNAAKTNLFPNYPANTATIYRRPRIHCHSDRCCALTGSDWEPTRKGEIGPR
jgi:hypothetical protein